MKLLCFPATRRMRVKGSGEAGLALISVLGVMFVLTLVAWAFVARIMDEQRHAGTAYRSTAALYLAEAGVQHALGTLSDRTASRSADRLAGYRESLGSGFFEIERIHEEAPGELAIVVRGEVGGVIRRVRRLVTVVPRVLGYGLFGGQVVLAGAGRTYIIPTAIAREGCERLGDVAASERLWLETGAALNALEGRPVTLRDGTLPDFALLGLLALPERLEDVDRVSPDLVLSRKAELVIGIAPWAAGAWASSHRQVPGLNVRAIKYDEVAIPVVNANLLRTMAAENRSNAEINRSAGDRVDRTLSYKDDSVYSPEQFSALIAYLGATRGVARRHGLSGVVFVDGAVTVGTPVLVEDGALIVNGTLRVSEGIRVEVRHGPKSRHLPGIMALAAGMVRLGPGAWMITDGLLFADAGLEVLKATVEVSGAIIAVQGVLNEGLLVVRYSPDVLRTIGLRRTEDILLHPIAWQELP